MRHKLHWPKVFVSLIASTGISLFMTAKVQTLMYAEVIDPLLRNAPPVRSSGPINLMGFEFQSTEMVMLFVVGLIMFTWLFITMLNQYDG